MARDPNPCAAGHLGEDRTKSLRHQPGIWELRDARGISCGYVCARCEDWKKAGYRADIFECSTYEADEDIDGDDW